ncbi:hypothetical protein NKG05_01235 [Oerskovia sp. M15]
MPVPGKESADHLEVSRDGRRPAVRRCWGHGPGGQDLERRQGRYEETEGRREGCLGSARHGSPAAARPARTAGRAAARRVSYGQRRQAEDGGRGVTGWRARVEHRVQRHGLVRCLRDLWTGPRAQNL